MKFISFIKKYVSERKFPNEFFLKFDNSQEALNYYHRSLDCYLYSSVKVGLKPQQPSILIKKRSFVMSYLYGMRHEYNRTVLRKIKNLFIKPIGAVVFDIGGSASQYTDVLTDESVVVFDRFIVADEGSGGENWQIPLLDLLEAQKKERKNLFYTYAEVEKLPTKNEKADLVICSEVFEHLPSDTIRFQVLNEIKRVLKRGGILLFSTPNTSDIIGRFKSLIKDKKYNHHGVWNDRRMIEVLEENDFEIITLSGTTIDWIFLKQIVEKFWVLIFLLRFIDIALEKVPFGWKLKHNTLIVASNTSSD